MASEERQYWDAWERAQDPGKHARFCRSLPSRKTSELLSLLLDSMALYEAIGSRLQFVVGSAVRQIFEEIDKRLPPREQAAEPVDQKEGS